MKNGRQLLPPLSYFACKHATKDELLLPACNRFVLHDCWHSFIREKKMDIGSKIKDLREENGLYQFEVADRVGIARNSLSQIERSRTRPSYEVLINLAREFDVSTDYLLGLEDEFGIKLEPKDSGRHSPRVEKVMRKLRHDIYSFDEFQIGCVLGYVTRIKEEK